METERFSERYLADANELCCCADTDTMEKICNNTHRINGIIRNGKKCFMKTPFSHSRSNVLNSVTKRIINYNSKI